MCRVKLPKSSGKSAPPASTTPAPTARAQTNFIKNGNFDNIGEDCGTDGSQSSFSVDKAADWQNPGGYDWCGCKKLGCDNKDGEGTSAVVGKGFAMMHHQNRYLSQQVTGLTQGNSYKLSFYATSRPRQGAAAMTVWAGDAAQSYSISDTFLGETGNMEQCSESRGECAFLGEKWKKFSFTFAAPSSKFFIKFLHCRGTRNGNNGNAPGCRTDSRLKKPTSGTFGSSPFVDNVKLTVEGAADGMPMGHHPSICPLVCIPLPLVRRHEA